MPVYGPSPGFRNLRWIKPVMAGDTLDYRTRTTGKRDLPNHPTRGLLTMVTQARNQTGDIGVPLRRRSVRGEARDGLSFWPVAGGQLSRRNRYL